MSGLLTNDRRRELNGETINNVNNVDDVNNVDNVDDDMYQENILDHYKHPRHKRTLTRCTFQHHEVNPVCGDMLTFYVDVTNGMIKDISFSGHGCAISQASASLLAEYLYGKSVLALEKLKPEVVYGLLGITISPGRVKCAMLSFVTVTRAYENYRGGKKRDNELKNKLN